MVVSVKGYRVVPQPLADRRAQGFRHLHLKTHGGAFKPSPPARKGLPDAFAKGHTLFVGNVDDQGGRLCRKTIEARLRRAFSGCGKIVHVQVSPAGGCGTSDRDALASCTSWAAQKSAAVSRYAHVSFSSAEGVGKALALEEVPSGLPRSKKRERGSEDADGHTTDDECRDENDDETCGYAALIQRHRRKFPPRDELQAEVDAAMKRYEQSEAAEAARRKALYDNPQEDEDGFVTVTYKRKRGKDTRTADSLGGPAELTSASKKKRKGASQLTDFYRFQMRETRREQLAALRSKFEKDKARVAKMKEQRKFKPF